MVETVLLHLLLIIFSLFFITISAGYIINALSSFGRKTGISEYLIGFIIVSAGTSLPELATAIVASVTNSSNLALGNIIGANIVDVTLVLGVTAIIGRKIFVHGKMIEQIGFTILFITLLPLILGVDGELSRWDGVSLLAAFFVYIIILFRKEGKFGSLKKEIDWKDIWQEMTIVTLAVVALLLSSHYMLFSAKKLSTLLNIPQFGIGLVIVALGTTLPELTVNIRSILNNVPGIAFGDILGSIVVNSSAVLGIAALIKPITFDSVRFINAAFFMVTSVYIALVFLKKKQITWQEGIGVILLYITFLVTEGLSGFF